MPGFKACRKVLLFIFGLFLILIYFIIDFHPGLLSRMPPIGLSTKNGTARL